MTMTTQSSQTDVVFLRGNPEDTYFTVIERDGPTVVLLGESEEQWTSMTLSYLEKNDVPVVFLPWTHLHAVRQALDVVHYPITQCWFGGKLQREVVGYQAEDLRQIVDAYLYAKSSKSTGDKHGKESERKRSRSPSG
jgi:hypothetical protein